MPRKRWRPTACKYCDATDADTPISARGLCQPCAIERMRTGSEQMHAKKGPAYDAWVESMRRVAETA